MYTCISHSQCGYSVPVWIIFLLGVTILYIINTYCTAQCGYSIPVWILCPSVDNPFLVYCSISTYMTHVSVWILCPSVDNPLAWCYYSIHVCVYMSQCGYSVPAWIILFLDFIIL